MKNKTYRSTIPRDGTIAATRIGINPFALPEIYHSLVTMPWARFFLVLLIPFLSFTLLFTMVNALIGFENFNGLTSADSIDKFWQLFLYNAQTLTTVGGANITPIGSINNIILTIESMVGMLGAATITGLLFVRLSRPSTGIIYSRNAIIAPYKEATALMVRIANAKKNEVVELNASVFLIINDLKTNKRDVKTLSLERSYLPFLAHSFTIVHRLDEQSPLKNLGWQDDESTQYEIAIWLNAFDRVTGQNVFSGHTYFMPEIIQNARFASCMEVDENGMYLIYLNKLSDYEMV